MATESLATRRRRRRYSAGWRAAGVRAWLPGLTVLIIVCLLVIPPLVLLVRTSFSENTIDGSVGAPTLEHFRNLLNDRNAYIATWNSIVFAALSTAFAVFIGSAIAWIVERTAVRLRILALVAAVVVLSMPSVVYVTAWLYLLGRAGPVNQLYRYIFSTDGVIFNVYSMTGMVTVSAFLWQPLVFLSMATSFRRANAEFEEAARISGASVRQTVWYISAKLALPAMLGVTMYVFIGNLESFDVPVFIGMPGDIKLLTSNIYISMTHFPPDVGLASSFSVLMVLLVVLLLQGYNRLTRDADRFASVTGKGFRPRPFNLGRHGWIASTILVLYFFVVAVLPIAAILWNSLSPYVRPFSLAGFKALNLDFYWAVLTDKTYKQLIVNTTVAGALGATLAVSTTVMGSWLAIRHWPYAKYIPQVTNLTMVLPGIVLGVALIKMALGYFPWVYGTLWLIAIAFWIKYLPIGMRYAYPGVIQLHRELEEAGGASGARQPRILRSIVLPMLSPTIITAWLFIFVLCCKELSLTILLAGTRSQVVATRMFDLWVNGGAGELAALGVIWSFLIIVITAPLLILQRRSGEQEKKG